MKEKQFMPVLELKNQLNKDRKFKRSNGLDGQRPATDRTLLSSSSEPVIKGGFVSSKAIGLLQRKSQHRERQSSKVEDRSLAQLLITDKTNLEGRQPIERSQSFSFTSLERMQKQIMELQEENAHLREKVANLNSKVQQNRRYESRSTNPMRENIHRQRAKELEKENLHLKDCIKGLEKEIEELREKRSQEQTASSIIIDTDSFSGSFMQNPELEGYEKEVSSLNEKVKKLMLQIDFINRKTYSEQEMMKNSFEQTVKNLKDRLADAWKTNADLKKQNAELSLKIRSISHQLSKGPTLGLNRKDTLLSLSSQGDL